MNIIFIGVDSIESTSYHRAMALKRLGHNVQIYNPFVSVKSLLNNKILGKFHYNTGYRFLQKKIYKWVLNFLQVTKEINLVWVDSGELIGLKAVQKLKTLLCPILLYNHDDPTGGRDGHRFDSLINAIPYYDLCVVVRNINISEYKNIRAKNVLLVSRSYDEIVHKPFDKIEDIPKKFHSDVAFIGTWMPKETRDIFLVEMIKNGIPVTIWGNGWEKSKHYDILECFHKGPNLSDRDYVAAIQGAKICIGMLSKGNRDLMTTRSVEIPFIGSVFCAERTSEHQSMYLEGNEAIFWNDAKECAKKCKELLADEVKQNDIRMAGIKRVREIKVGNEDICKKILNEIFKLV